MIVLVSMHLRCKLIPDHNRNTALCPWHSSCVTIFLLVELPNKLYIVQRMGIVEVVYARLLGRADTTELSAFLIDQVLVSILLRPRVLHMYVLGGFGFFFDLAPKSLTSSG